jgi:DMSO/TMAO reductase YedYZ molybdopterin-dependent catalytic subunit
VRRRDVPADRLPPGQRLAKGWPALHYGPVPAFDPATWDFRVFGAVGRPATLGYEDLKALPAVRSRRDFHCVTKFSVLDVEWEGVAVSRIAELVEVSPSSRFVMAHCEYGYEANVPLDAVLEDGLLAWGAGGEPLTLEHGFPLRLVVPKLYGWKSAKWIRGLEFMEEDRRGFWEERGYHNDADPWLEQRYSFQERAEGARSIWRRFVQG